MNRIEEIRERVEKASPEPWVQGRNHPDEVFDAESGLRIAACAVFLGNDQAEDNAAFIAEAREDIPYLLSRVEALEKVREAGKAWVATGPNIDDMETENLYAALAAAGEAE